MVYVALAPNYWGVGETAEAAKQNMTEAGGSLKKYVVYRLPEGATDVQVDPIYGQVSWAWEGPAPAPRFGEMIVVESKGV